MKTLEQAETQREIQDRLSRLSNRDQPRWGKMSSHQMLCHLRDSYGVALGEKTVSSATGPAQRTLLKWAALWLPVRWSKGFPTRPEIEQGRGGSVPDDFELDKNALQVVLKRFCLESMKLDFPHPVFGSMKAREWWRWGYLHADHHLRQFGR